MMIDAIILAAGNSTRIGYPKALLKIKNLTFIEVIVLKLLKSNINNILVILGENYKIIKPILENYPVKIYQNKKVSEGQISSLRIGIKNLSKDTEAFISYPVDFPFVKEITIRQLIKKFYSTDKNIIIPTYNDRRGHPVIYKKKVFPLFDACPNEEGAKWILKNFSNEIYGVKVRDIGVILNINSLQDYLKALEMNYPNE